MNFSITEFRKISAVKASRTAPQTINRDSKARSDGRLPGGLFCPAYRGRIFDESNDRNGAVTSLWKQSNLVWTMQEPVKLAHETSYTNYRSTERLLRMIKYNPVHR